MGIEFEGQVYDHYEAAKVILRIEVDIDFYEEVAKETVVSLATIKYKRSVAFEKVHAGMIADSPDVSDYWEDFHDLKALEKQVYQDLEDCTDDLAGLYQLNGAWIRLFDKLKERAEGNA